MKWAGRRESSNIEDAGSGGGLGRIAPVGGIGTLVIGLIIYFLGGDPSVVLNSQPSQPRNAPAQSGRNTSAELSTPERKFVAVVLGDTEDVWGALFKAQGERYVQPKLVLFQDAVQSACGVAGSSSGPFYCPPDKKLYLDLSFFQELDRKYGAPGDFAQAYVIAHEVGHHVQDQIGILSKVRSMQARASKAEANQLSVRLELQADYFAGVWAHHAQKRNLLDVGDLDEALQAAASVGDDTISQRAQGYTVPESFTHGTAQQRAKWFKRGFEYGDFKHGDTFSGAI